MSYTESITIISLDNFIHIFVEELCEIESAKDFSRNNPEIDLFSELNDGMDKIRYEYCTGKATFTLLNNSLCFDKLAEIAIEKGYIPSDYDINQLMVLVMTNKNMKHIAYIDIES